MDGWKTSFLLGRAIFRGYVSFREGNGWLKHHSPETIDPMAIHRKRDVNLSDEKNSQPSPPKKHPKSSPNIWAWLGLSDGGSPTNPTRKKPGESFRKGGKFLTQPEKHVAIAYTKPKFNGWNLKVIVFKFGISYSRVPFSGEAC